MNVTRYLFAILALVIVHAATATAQVAYTDILLSPG